MAQIGARGADRMSAWVVRRKSDQELNGVDEFPSVVESFWGVYHTREEAEWAARELDRADMVVNGTTFEPFAGGLESATSLPEYALRDWLLDRDIPPPNGRTLVDWRVWWQWVRKADRPLTREQFRHVLAALNKLPLHLYEVVSVPRPEPEPLPEVVYAAIRRDWVYNDVTFEGGDEPQAVYRTRAAAEAECARRAAADPRYRGPLTMGEAGRWQTGATDYVVVELPLSPEG